MCAFFTSGKTITIKISETRLACNEMTVDLLPETIQRMDVTNEKSLQESLSQMIEKAKLTGKKVTFIFDESLYFDFDSPAITEDIKAKFLETIPLDDANKELFVQGKKIIVVSKKILDTCRSACQTAKCEITSLQV